MSSQTITIDSPSRLGVHMGYVLADADESAFSHTRVNTPASQHGPAVPGTMSEFRIAHGDNSALISQLQNDIKSCGACGKVCGYNLSFCNACGATLPAEVSHSNNIFMAFVYGIEKVPFPAQISIRHQTPELLPSVGAGPGYSLSANMYMKLTPHSSGIRRPSLPLTVPPQRHSNRHIYPRLAVPSPQPPRGTCPDHDTRERSVGVRSRPISIKPRLANDVSSWHGRRRHRASGVPAVPRCGGGEFSTVAESVPHPVHTDAFPAVPIRYVSQGGTHDGRSLLSS